MKIVRIPSSRLKRLVAVGMGPALWLLALDAGVSHLAGRGEPYVAQLVPVYFGAAAGLVLILGGWRLGDAALQRLLRAVGVLSVSTGGAGVYFHSSVLVRDLLRSAPVDLSVLGEGLAVTPPLLAPLSFVGLGVLLVAVGLRGLHLSYQGPVPAMLSRRLETIPSMRAPCRPAEVETEEEDAKTSRSDVA